MQKMKTMILFQSKDTYLKMTWLISKVVDILFLLLMSGNFDVKKIKINLSIALKNSIPKSQFNFLFQQFNHLFLSVKIIE